MAAIETILLYRMFTCLCFIILAISHISTSTEFNLLRLREHSLWLTIENKMYEVNTLNIPSTPRHILTWFQPKHCTHHRLSTSCSGFVTHSTEIEEDLFEICGVIHNKAFCGLYTTSAQGMLSAVSEKRVADELVNRALEPSLLQHSDGVMVILKRREEDDQLPLLILRRGYSQNSSALRHPGANPNWWKVQLFSRNFQLPRSQEFDLVHQRLHSPYHYLFFNRAQSFRNPLDDFLSPPGPRYETQSTLVVRFCLNDNGLQMPDSGLAVFTTLLKAKLSCSLRLPTFRNAPAFYARNRDHETEPLLTFDHIVTSDSFIGPDKDLFFVGLFTWTETSSSQRLQQSMELMGSPMALCIFRASDLSDMATQTSLAIQIGNEPARKLFETNCTVGGASDESLRFLRLNGSAEQLRSVQFGARLSMRYAVLALSYLISSVNDLAVKSHECDYRSSTLLMKLNALSEVQASCASTK
ncbi:unnamed protein product [Hydatigera taeniaeformis]|uniref:Sema domain-containing protein n=1 Tax=Hydatigena taeniaeformis TaxID=6205 RepID=A0A158RDU8_HYDTA|nr:unnamed protein product [Hydatigera taeniaeformis]